MENTTYKVNVTSPGQTVFYRNRVSRTPVMFSNVFEHELAVLELQLTQKSLSYKIEKNTSEDPKEQVDPVIEENEEVEVEELYTKKEEPESILDKLIADDQ